MNTILKTNRLTPPTLILLILGLLGMAGLLTWANYHYAAENPGGNDFLVHWMGTRNYLTEGVSPYSDATAVKIQTMAYGHPAEPGEHELRVAYPFYSMLIFAPFALIKDFTMARAVWMTVLEICLLAMTFFSMRLTQYKPGLGMTVALLLFGVCWYHGLRALINGNAVILVATLLYGGLLALQLGRDELAGFLMALTTIKPQVVLVVLAFILIWGLMKKRYKLVGWLVGTVLVLFVGATLIRPTWIVQNLAEIIRYPSYNPPGTPGAALAEVLPAMGPRIGWVLTALLCLLLYFEWRASKKYDFRGFLWAVCLSLLASQWIGIQTDPGNFVILFLPVILVLAGLEERWGRTGRWINIGSLVLLLVGLWAIFLLTLEPGPQPQQSSLMFLPLPLILWFGLYWVRWWMVHPTTTWVDQLKQQEKLGR